jgi:formamidopyrimidine-DNA glycosylase
LLGAEVVAIRRRGKYLLFDFPKGHLLVHLGMSGRLTMVPDDRPVKAHDHVDVCLEGHESLRLNDPRRFGAMLWITGPAERHALLRGLGVEPFDAAFTGEYLHQLARGRRVAVKHFIMNASVVTGVGNIYASEALFRAGIHPSRPVGRISLDRWNRLAQAVRDTLLLALNAGGSTLRDYVSASGEPGQFQNVTSVYAREGEPCRACRRPIKALRQGQRSTFYCAGCQK